MFIYEIVNELIFNAVKHTSEVNESNVHIGISSSSLTVIIKVKNDGATLPAQFDFKNGQGLGTGLSLIKSLLPRQGAELSIQQIDNDVVSTLTLTIPVLLNDEKGEENNGNNNRKIA